MRIPGVRTLAGLARSLPLPELPLPGLEGLRGPDGPSADEIDGYFPADSMIRRVHRQRLVAFSGVRALFMQACDPLAVVGFQRHSAIFSDPKTRLQSTDERMSRMYFGDAAQAEATGAEIREMHSRVRGKTAKDYGPIPAGTPYAADDPDLGLWTLTTLADSALVYYGRLIGELDPDERQSYWDDYRRIGELLGMPVDSMPSTEPEMRDYVRGRCRDGTLWISGEVRDLAIGVIFEPPFEGWVRLALTPVGEVVKLTTIGLLPPELRRMYGFNWDPAREALLRSTIVQLRIASKAWPDLVRLHPAARAPAGELFGAEGRGEEWRAEFAVSTRPVPEAQADDDAEPDEVADGNRSVVGALSRLEQALSDEPRESRRGVPDEPE